VDAHGKRRKRYGVTATTEVNRVMAMGFENYLDDGFFVVWDTVRKQPLWDPKQEYPGWHWYRTRQAAWNWLKKTTVRWYRIREVEAKMDGYAA
jgi:hypothetical protein